MEPDAVAPATPSVTPLRPLELLIVQPSPFCNLDGGTASGDSNHINFRGRHSGTRCRTCGCFFLPFSACGQECDHEQWDVFGHWLLRCAAGEEWGDSGAKARKKQSTI